MYVAVCAPSPKHLDFPQHSLTRSRASLRQWSRSVRLLQRRAGECHFRPQQRRHPPRIGVRHRGSAPTPFPRCTANARVGTEELTSPLSPPLHAGRPRATTPHFATTRSRAPGCTSTTAECPFRLRRRRHRHRPTCSSTNDAAPATARCVPPKQLCRGDASAVWWSDHVPRSSTPTDPNSCGHPGVRCSRGRER